MAAPTKLEFAVQMTCQSCVNAVEKSLHGVDGIKLIDVDLDKEQVVVETNLPSNTVKDMIESSGRRAVLKGMGSSAGTSHLGAAVSILEAGSDLIKGVIRFVQTDQSTCVIEGTVDGLSPGKHALSVHDYGDISFPCSSCGDVFGKSGSLTDEIVGQLGDITAGKDGRVEFRMQNERLKVWDIIGRSMVVHAGETAQLQDNNDNERLVCGIIARSAGLFQNPKKICACDGVALWDERDKPVAGPGRQSKI